MPERLPYKPYFDKNMTNLLKGLMLVFMFCHHFFQFPQWYVKGVSYPSLEWFVQYVYQLRICVPVFAFLTGYFYAFGSRHDYRYSWRKIVGVAVPYWLVLVPFLLIALLTGTADCSFLSLLGDVLAWRCRIMVFCWYVLFYAETMLLLPLLTRPQGKPAKIAALLAGIWVPVVAYHLVQGRLSPSWYQEVANDFQTYFPLVLVGYACAMAGAYQRLDALSGRLGARLKAVAGAVLAVVMFAGQAKLCCWQAEHPWLYLLPRLLWLVSVPLFVYGVVLVMGQLSWRWLAEPLQLIGRLSLPMWFLHCIFFNVSRDYTQRILFFPVWPPLVLLWGLVLCGAVGWLVNRVSEWLLKRLKIS